jgi:NADPH:quinone reductase-like Zn-dependent oxidoreductase
VPKEEEVLVRVHASTVTRGEAMGVRSKDYRFTRLFTGIRRPRWTIFGSELAGSVRPREVFLSPSRAGMIPSESR